FHGTLLPLLDFGLKAVPVIADDPKFLNPDEADGDAGSTQGVKDRAVAGLLRAIAVLVDELLGDVDCDLHDPPSTKTRSTPSSVMVMKGKRCDSSATTSS